MLKDYEKAGFSQIRRCWSMTACPAKKCTIFLTAASDRLAGLGIYEYAPSGVRNALVEKLIRFGTAL